MYLKKLELKGFKSFPNKTDIMFENGITSIVGPNGSGKSNVSDAIRWVLGEQSIKSLRGEKLEDVIFAGTDTKKPMNYCEVALTIDNTDNILNIDYSEVTIKRIAYKSGESEFYLNNKSCRLKDIKELLLDTGIGREGYSVIEQGKIDEILSSNSNNRRKVFDEACGISKYRYKKQEGEKNLKVTKENLDRIDDIFCEIQNQLKPLETQKNKSLKYIDLREELKVLETNNYIREIEDLDTQLKEINNHKEILQNQLNNLEETKNKEKVDVSNLENNLSILETRINDLNENLHKFQVEIDRKIANENLLNEKIKNIDINTQREEHEVKGLKSNIDKNEYEEKDLLEDKIKLDIKIDLLKKEKDSIYNKIKEYSENLKCKEEKIENLKNNIINLMNDKNSKIVKSSSSKANLDNMNTRQELIKKELNDTYFKINEKNIELDKNIEFKNKSDKSLQNSISRKQNEVENLEKLRDDLKYIETSINNKNLMMNEYNSKLNIYIEMEKQHDGFNKGVKEVLKNKDLNGILGAVAEVIKVPKEYETAVEVSLGASLQNIITDNEINAKEGIEYLKKNNLGRVTFLPLNIIKSKKINLNDIPKVEGLLGIASDKINCDIKFKNIIDYMLGKTILVKDIDVAIKLGKITNHKYKIVTLQGDVFNPGGSLTGGSVKTVNNILSRKRLIEEFEEKINDCKVDLEKILNKRNNLDENIENKNKELSNLEVYIKDEEKLNLTINSNIDKTKEEINNLNDIISKLKREENGLNENLTYTKDSINSLELQINDIEINISTIEKIIRETAVEKESDKKIYDKDVEVLNDLNINITKFLEIYKGKEKEINRISEELSKFKVDLCEKQENIKKNKIEKQNLEENLILIRVEKEELKESVNNIGKKFEEYKIKKINLTDNLKIKKEELKNLENHYLELKESIYKLDSKIDKLEMSQENYFNKLWSEYELTYHEALKFRNNDVIEKKKIEFLKLEIKKLGNVNLDSIDEYKEVKERHDFYKDQKEDLEKSIESIEKLIKDMESNMKYEFSSNFERINETFIKVYKKLFGGGCGELKLVDPSNILESDIEIIAQPPGKKLKNINLLSGGEKALTAICVLFAILLIKPTPFCVLDEIEAPLDDANIYRFGEFLKDLSKSTQFITITHRRGTMESSDYIYGVTMQERAISKVVSLKLEEAKNITEENIG